MTISYIKQAQAKNIKQANSQNIQYRLKEKIEMAVAKRPGSAVNKYMALLKKLEETKQESGFWKPETGKNVIRILPEVGNMEFFFVESGRHYMDKKSYECANLNSGGAERCPLCDVNQLMYEAGEIPEAKKWRASKSYLMNVIVRGSESEGPKIYAAGQIVFGQIASLIGDPDIGDVSDIEEGFDIILDRTGEGMETRYTSRPSRNPSPLGSAEEVEKWLKEAKDLQAYVDERIPEYEEMATQSGAAVFLGLVEGDEEEPVEEEYDEEEADEEPVKASDRIRERMGSGRNLKLGKR
jgi:hypothetical protein